MNKKYFIASIIAPIVLAALVITITAIGQQQNPGIKRTDLQRHDLSVQGREVIQTRVDIPPGVLAPRHSHPGEEIIYVIEGEFEYQVEGRAPLIVKTGEVLFVPAGAV